MVDLLSENPLTSQCSHTTNKRPFKSFSYEYSNATKVDNTSSLTVTHSPVFVKYYSTNRFFKINIYLFTSSNAV